MNQHQPKKKTPKVSSPTRIFTNLLLIGAVGALGFWQLKQQSQAAWAQMAQQANTVSELQTQVQLLQTQKHAPQAAWRLEQAQEYVKMANIKMSQDYQPNQAMALLQAAEDTLQNVPVPDIKAKLQEYLQYLAQHHDPNVLTIYQAMGKAKAMISALEMSRPSMQVTVDENAPPTPGLNHWQEKLWSKLQKVVIIRHSDTTIKPLLQESEQMVFRANLIVAMNMAQWSLLHQDLNGFHSAIGQCLSWLHDIASQNEGTRALATQLHTIDSMAKEIPLMDLSPLLVLFADHHNMGLVPSKPAHIEEHLTPPYTSLNTEAAS